MKYISILLLVRDLIIVQKFGELAVCGVKSEFVRIVLTTGNEWLKVIFLVDDAEILKTYLVLATLH